MKRVSIEMSEFDLFYIRKILTQDYLLCSNILLDTDEFDDEDEEMRIKFCYKHSKFLADKILSFLTEQKDV